MNPTEDNSHQLSIELLYSRAVLWDNKTSVTMDWTKRYAGGRGFLGTGTTPLAKEEEIKLMPQRLCEKLEEMVTSDKNLNKIMIYNSRPFPGITARLERVNYDSLLENLRTQYPDLLIQQRVSLDLRQ